MKDRSISRAGYEQGGIASASVCSFQPFLEFELLESLLIGGSWLTAGFGGMAHRRAGLPYFDSHSPTLHAIIALVLCVTGTPLMMY